MPYDFYCPTVQDSLSERTCIHCGKYFASKKGVATHIKHLHPKSSFKKGVNRVKPYRIIAKRNSELLCALKDTSSCGQTDWIDEEDVDVIGLTVPREPPLVRPISVIESMEDWLSPTWIDDTDT